MIRKELEKKLKVLEKTLNQIDAMKLEANADPATAPAFSAVVSELDKARETMLSLIVIQVPGNPICSNTFGYKTKRRLNFFLQRSKIRRVLQSFDMR